MPHDAAGDTLDGAPHGARRVLPGGLSLSGALSLLAVTAVLVVVSVPRLQDMAVQENEVDARATARMLALALSARDAQREPELEDLLRLPELAGVRADAELLAQGRLLRRHGYLFELTHLPPALELAPLALLAAGVGPTSVLAVRAWPWAHGKTGRALILATDTGAALVRENTSPRCEGPGCAGASFPADGWRSVN